MVLAIVLSHCRLIRSHWQLIYAQSVIIEALGVGQAHLAAHLAPKPHSHTITNPVILAAGPLERKAALAAAPLTSFLFFGQLSRRGGEEVPDAGIPLP